jgi:pimeloyl-ACP methyl ester carboxylesterase
MARTEVVMAISEALGERHEIELPSGRIAYRERGSGRPVVFIHGLLVNGDLWRNVVPTVADAGFRCIVPDLPLGSHETPMHPDADLSPPGLAGIIASFLDALGVDDAVLVANDTGGALTQLVITQHPKRVGAVVFTNCDCFERFFPPLFRYLQLLPKIPGAIRLLGQAIRLRLVQRMPTAFGSLTHAPIPRDVMASYVGHVRDPGIRRDVTKVLRGVDKSYTLAAARDLESFDRPALLAWGVDDRNFRLVDAERLAAALPASRLEPITGARTFVPEDQPATLAQLVVAFAR